jgi:hypothetical protein
MATKSTSNPWPPSIPVAARKLFEQFSHPLISNRKAYQKRLVEVLSALQITTTIEAFWGKDFLDATLDLERLRDLEAALLEFQSRRADQADDIQQRSLAEVFANFAVSEWCDEHGLDHRLNTPEITAKWNELYEERLSQTSNNPGARPATPHDLVQSFLDHGAELDQVSRWIATVEARRRSALKELEHYRAARQMRANTRGVSTLHAAVLLRGAAGS